MSGISPTASGISTPAVFAGPFDGLYDELERIAKDSVKDALQDPETQDALAGTVSGVIEDQAPTFKQLFADSLTDQGPALQDIIGAAIVDSKPELTGIVTDAVDGFKGELPTIMDDAIQGFRDELPLIVERDIKPALIDELTKRGADIATVANEVGTSGRDAGLKGAMTGIGVGAVLGYLAAGGAKAMTMYGASGWSRAGLAGLAGAGLGAIAIGFIGGVAGYAYGVDRGLGNASLKLD